jgi:hypothetical protein
MADFREMSEEELEAHLQQVASARNLVLAIERPAGDEWSADLRDAEGHGLYSATGVTRHAAARDLALFLEQEE